MTERALRTLRLLAAVALSSANAVIDNSDPRRDALHEFLQSQGPPNDETDDDDRRIDTGAVLTGWIVVSEWMDPQGEKWLVRGYSAGKSKWDADGMAHEFLYGNW